MNNARLYQAIYKNSPEAKQRRRKIIIISKLLLKEGTLNRGRRMPSCIRKALRISPKLSMEVWPGKTVGQGKTVRQRERLKKNTNNK